MTAKKSKKHFKFLRTLKKDNRDIYISIFLVSLAVLALELVLNRMLGLRFWYHFTFMIISNALFGIGVGGLLVFFTNALLKKFPSIVIAVSILALAISIPYMLITINNNPLQIDKVVNSAQHQQYFIHFFLILSIPFILAGFIFSYIFTNYRKDIANIYFFDLAGGGIGCLFSLIVFPHRGPFATAFFISALVLIACAFVLYKKTKGISLVLTIILIALGLYYLYPSLENIEATVGRSKRYARELGKKVFGDWDNFGYVAVHDKEPNCKVATANYSTYANIFVSSNKATMENFKNMEQTKDHQYPFVIRKAPENVGIIGVGAGKDILISLIWKSKNIYGVEFSPAMYEVLMKRYTRYTGNIGNLSNVHMYREEGRFFIRSSKRNYDILIFDNAIAIAAFQSGAFTLAEGYLYTVEAIIDYMNHLTRDGLLYLSNPFPDHARFITIIREAFKKMGREKEFKDCIYVVNNMSKSYPRCKIIVKNRGFTPQEINTLMTYTEQLKQQAIYAPGRDLKTFAQTLVLTKDIERQYEVSHAELRPSTDDWPFYSQTVKLNVKAYEWAEKNISYYYTEPFLLLNKITKSVLKYSLLFLILPLVLLNLKGFKKLQNKVSSVIYFASLGLGFMFMEIVLMQKYMLILGHPVYSFSAVLASLLISSGIGSFYSDKIKNPYNAVRRGLTGIIISTIAVYLFIKFAGPGVIQLPFLLRVVIISLFTAVSGFFMGFMMPSGIRAVSRVESSIPWLWSINSVFSVLAGFLAIYMSILYGFTIVLVTSIACYLIGSIAFCYKMVLRQSK